MSRTGLDRTTGVAVAKLATLVVIAGLMTALLLVLIGSVTLSETKK